MELLIVGTGSQGNSYILKSSKGEHLLIDAGMKFIEIKKAMDFDLSGLKNMIVTHSHLDHSKYCKDFIKAGINVYSTPELAKKIKGVKELAKTEPIQLGEYKVLPFEAKHDVECYSFLIQHPECGKIVFITDSYYCKHTFNNVNNWIIEANYSKKIIDKKIEEKGINLFLKDRILKSHMSLENCIDTLKANNLSSTRNIILIHLSDSNSDEKEFISEVEKATYKPCYAARNGMKINLNIF